MRGFMVLCLATVAIAAPQGYNYPQPSGGIGGGIGGIGGGFGGIGGGGGGIGGGIGGGFGRGGGGGGGAHHHAPVITKHFHTFSAPEEGPDAGESRVISAGPAHKHYRVVFIKAPHQSASSAALSVAQAQNEEKTVIYVLSRKIDASDIQANIQAAPHNPSKPEVFFIKYKTPAEAAHAQRTIQAQYDSLGGTSQITDEGLAPVQSVIGALGGGHGGHGGGIGGGHGGGISGGGFGGGSIAAPSGNYLPPN